MLPEAALAMLMSVTSPDGINTLTVSREGERLLFAVSRRGKPILAPAPIGLEVAGARLGGTPRVTTFAHDFSAEVPFHTVRAHIDLKANCATADFGDLSLTILSTDQGVAYRWTIVAAGEAITPPAATYSTNGDPEATNPVTNVEYRVNGGNWTDVSGGSIPAQKAGDEVEVQVLNYDEANKKINLSMKACIPEEPKPAKQESGDSEKKVRKAKAKKVETDEEVEWNEETANNPFADLLKDLNIKE